MDKPIGPWVTLAFGVALLGLGVFLVLANPWARGGAYFVGFGLIVIVVALSTLFHRGRNSKRS